MTAPAPAKTPAKVETEYVILVENKPADTNATGNTGSKFDLPKTTYSVASVLSATNADAAIRQAAGEKPGVYRAIPARSWKPVTLTVETKTTVKLA